MSKLYLIATIGLLIAIFSFQFFSSTDDAETVKLLTELEGKPTSETPSYDKATIVDGNPTNKKADGDNDKPSTSDLLANSVKLTEYDSSKMIRSADLGNFSENVYNVREKIALGLPPERDELIAAMREVYKDRPESFRRNLERSFENTLNPKPFCNSMRKEWASPYIAEVGAGYVFINEEIWQGNGPSNKAQLAKYLSKCTQDSQPLELISHSSGHTIAYYSLQEGYQLSANH